MATDGVDPRSQVLVQQASCKRLLSVSTVFSFSAVATQVMEGLRALNHIHLVSALVAVRKHSPAPSRPR